jgi:hypothetical protein
MIPSNPARPGVYHASTEKYLQRRQREKSLGTFVGFPDGTADDMKRVGLALQRIREDAAVVHQLMQGSKHRRRVRLQAHAEHIRGLATRSLVSFTEQLNDLTQ